MKRFYIPQSVVILLAMFIGLVLGGFSQQVFFGVDNIANAFVLLLQMTALPYITLSLMVGIGSLTVSEAKGALIASISALFALSAAVLVFILLAPISFPDWKNADFYSANTVKTAIEFDLIKLFIPANPFSAFANAVIPSVVVFSVFIGIGLMFAQRKKQTLVVLSTLQTAVAEVSNIIMKFAPIGVFCIAQRAAATINADDINGLTVYIVTAIALVVFLSFAVLPAIVAIVTPFSYRQVIMVSQKAMVTAFATGSFFIVIPMIVEKTKLLIKSLNPHTVPKPSSCDDGAEPQISEQEKHSAAISADISKLPSIIVPITFSLPVGGKFLALLFTLFAAWFSGAHISSADYVNLLVAGIPQLFGTSTLAMPHLLDLFNVSSSMFDFFLVSESLIVGRLGALLSVVFSTCVPLLIAAIAINKLTLNWRKFAVNFLILPVLAVIMFFGLRVTFDKISYQYSGYEVFIDRDFLYAKTQSRYLKAPENLGYTEDAQTDVLTRIQDRGYIRIGYFRDDLPYSFHNKDGKLVGFDIEIMSLLAADLGVDVEFVRIFHDQAAPLLESGYLDLTSGIPVIPDNMKEFTLTVPYSNQEIAFLVKDNRRAEFTHWHKITEREDLIIGIPETFFYQDAVKRGFTKGKAWEISTPRLFFKEEYQHIDGMLFGAAAASGWTLLYPEYTVVVPKPAIAPLSMAFPINKNDQAFELFMRNWINMKKQSKTLERLFTYWIEGKDPDQ